MNRILPTLVLVLLVLFALSLSFFTVDQRQYAVVFQFSEAVRVVKERASISRCRSCRKCAISTAASRPSMATRQLVSDDRKDERQG